MNLDLSTWVPYFPAIIASFSFVIAMLSAVSARRSAKIAQYAAEQQGGSFGLTALREQILHEFVEREFRPTAAPVINGQPILRLREAMRFALVAYKDDSKAWNKSSNVSNLDQWQNKVAYELADVLESFGVAAFTGTMGVSMTLAIVGDVIVDGWVLCHSWVGSYREREGVKSRIESEVVPLVYYHRRHAEWLSLIATLWMSRCWTYERCEDTINNYGGVEKMRARIIALSRAEGLPLRLSVKNEIRSLVGIGL